MTGFSNMYGGNGKLENRVVNDSYPTPPFATRALLDLIKFEDGYTILEPCAGRGWMASELSRNNLNIKAFDLYEYENPLHEVSYGFDALETIKFIHPAAINTSMVTNPPFNKDFPQKLIEACLQQTGINRICILQRLTWMESKKRLKLFTDHPLSIVAIFSCRFSCEEKYFESNPIGGMVSYAWYIWDKTDTSGITEMKWIDGQAAYNKWKEEIDETNKTSNSISSPSR